MSHVFISYASDDRERVLPLVEALQDDGFTVWWDRSINPGPSFDREIERAVDGADCMIVLWSSRSIESEWVRSEVEEGVRRNILVPAMIEAVMPPLAYRRRQAADLSDWDGERTGEYESLLNGIQAAIANSAASDTESAAEPLIKPQSTLPRRRRTRIPIAAAGAAVIISAVAAGLAGWALSGGTGGLSASAGGEVAHLEFSLPAGMSIVGNTQNPVTITPDGGTVLFGAQRSSGMAIYMMRRLADPGIQTLGDELETLGSHWLSPNGEWLVFNEADSRTYRKMRLDGRAAVSIAPRPESDPNGGGIRGLSWSPDDEIAFAGDSLGIQSVPAGGGTPAVLLQPPEDVLYSEPHYSYDGGALFFTQIDISEDAEGDVATVQVMDRSSGAVTELTTGRRPTLTRSDHLVLLRDGTLWAAPFDRSSLTLLSEPVPVLEGISDGATGYAISDNGTLVYVPQRPDDDLNVELAWVATNGQIQSLIALPEAAYARLSESDDSVILSAASNSGSSFAIWNHSFEKETTTKLTFAGDPRFSVQPTVSPDGESYVYIEGANGNFEIFMSTMDGASEPVRLTKDARANEPRMAPDGETVVFLHCAEGNSQCDIASTRVDDQGFQVLLETPFRERGPEISPDGSWLAYASDESGQFEIYVRPFPDLRAGRWQVSNSGGEAPMWSRDGKQLFYVERDSSEMKSVAVSEGASFSATPPETALDIQGFDWSSGPRDARGFDISSDGERFLMLRQTGNFNRLMVVINWLEQVRKAAPGPG